MAREREYSQRHRSKETSRSRSPRRRSPHHRDGPSNERRDRRSQSPAHKRRRTTTRSPSKERRSPAPDSRHSSHRNHSRHHHHHHSSSHRSKHREHRESSDPVSLPFSARPLRKADLPSFRPLFAYFLSLQKQIELDDLDEREEKGRWKSFVGKWNRGELAEGWYDPDMFARVMEQDPGPEEEPEEEQGGSRSRSHEWQGTHADDVGAGGTGVDDEGDEDDDDYGPPPPPSARGDNRSGPRIPSAQDISMRNEMLEDDREESRMLLREARRKDRATQKERLEELLPRADPGSRERKMEKRQALNDKMREFRDKSPGVEGGDERDLMGGGDSVEEYKKMKEVEKRKKTEREIRREEMERARQEEIEEKRRAYQEREEETVNMLRELARQKFG